MTDDNQPVPKSWGNFAKIRRYQVTKPDVDLFEKIIGAWTASLATAATISGLTTRTTSAIWFSIAVASAALVFIFIYIRHRRQNKRLIYWRVTLPLVMLHLVLCGISIEKLSETVVRPHAPTLFTLWASEFTNGQQNRRGHADVLVQGSIVRLFDKQVQDFDENAKILTVYIPDTPYTVQLCAAIANDFQNFVSPKDLAMEGDAGGEPYPYETSSLIFTGRVVVYHEAFLLPEEITAIKTIFDKVGATVQLRGSDYATMVGDVILAGRKKQPPDFKLQNGLPCRITPRKFPPAEIKGNHVHTFGGDDFTDVMCKAE